MNPLSLVLGVLFAVSIRAEDPIQHDHILNILKGYERDLVPNAENFSVKFSITPLCLDLEDNGSVDINAWYRFFWTDPRLSWDPEEHHGLTQVNLDPSYIWTPDIVNYRRIDWDNGPVQGNKIRGMSTNAVVMSSGLVIWVPPMKEKSFCKGEEGDDDLDDYWGVKNCTFKFGSWTYSGPVMDIVLENEWADPHYMEGGCRTKLISESAVRQEKYYDCCPEPYPSLELSYKLQRKYRINPDGSVTRNPFLTKECECCKAKKAKKAKKATTFP